MSRPWRIEYRYAPREGERIAFGWRVCGTYSTDVRAAERLQVVGRAYGAGYEFRVTRREAA